MNMFKANAAKTPTEYFAAIKDEDRRRDMKKLHGLIRKTAPSLEPYMIAGLIGYGTYRYTNASGRTVDWCILGLSSRAAYISFYVCAIKNGKYVAESYKKALPKADIGKSCVRFKRLEDLDPKVLEKLIREGAKGLVQV